MTRTPLDSFCQPALGAALLLALAAPASAQDVVIPRPGTTTTTTVTKPGTTGIPIMPGTIQIPTRPGTPVTGTTTTTTKTTMAIPGPAGTLVIPGGTVIKRVDVPPLMTGTPAIDVRTPNPNLRLIDPAALFQMNVPPTAGGVTSTAAQTVAGPEGAVVAGRRGDAILQEPVTQIIQEPASVDVVTGPADALAPTDVQLPSADPLANTGTARQGAPASRAPEARPRPDNRLSFSAKDGMHVYYITPLDAKAAERSRVDGSMSALSTFINQRSAAAPVQMSPDDGVCTDRHRLCTHKDRPTGGLPFAGPAAGAGNPPKAPPAPKPSHAEDYWQRSLESATSQWDKASSDLSGAERDTRRAEDDLERAKAEVGRLTELVNYWDPKKADPKIQGHTHVVERLDGPGNTKQPTGRVEKRDTYTRLKTKAETEQDLEQAKKDRDTAEARVRGAQARERVFRQRRDDAARGREWAETKLDQAKAGDPAGNPPGPNGPVIVR